jgi:hypothetical protein
VLGPVPCIECICGHWMVSNGLLKIPIGAAMADARTECICGHWMVSNGMSLSCRCCLGLVPHIECICGYCSMVSNGLVSNGLINIPRGAAMADASTEFVYGHWMVSNGLSLPLLGLVPRIECVCGHWMVSKGLQRSTQASNAFVATGWSRNDLWIRCLWPLDGLKMACHNSERLRNDRRKH